MKTQKNKLEKATFGAGCFWQVEEEFHHVKGVLETSVGYEGGTSTNPSYEIVCTDRTGHAEVVELLYNPKKVSYEKLLDIFWMNHNPTTLNRQGLDVGTQYRSVIFYHDEKQKEQAEKSKQKIEKSGRWKNPVVTQIVPAMTFWKAEEYHQKYLHKRGLTSCRFA